MAATLTVTGVTGPGDSLSAVVYTNVLWFRVDADLNILSFQKDGMLSTTYITVNSASTVTATKSGTTWALTIS